MSIASGTRLGPYEVIVPLGGQAAWVKCIGQAWSLAVGPRDQERGHQGRTEDQGRTKPQALRTSRPASRDDERHIVVLLVAAESAHFLEDVGHDAAGTQIARASHDLE